jgi:glucose/arabinose dehydrogenase
MSVPKTSLALRTFIVLALTTVALAPVTAPAQATAPAPAQATAPAKSASVTTLANPVGTWSVSVTIQGVGTFPATFHYVSNGVLLIAGRGSGVWFPTGSDTIAIRAAEGNFDANGVYAGWLDIRQTHTLNGNTLSGSGVTAVYDANDAFVQNANVSITATKV